MKKIRELLKEKGGQVWSIAPDASVYEAMQLMADQEIGSVMVLENGKMVGLLTERDYARNVILKGRTSKDTLVRDIMTTRVVCADPDETVEECMAVMTEKRVRHLPVIVGGEVLGIVSIGDLVKSIICEQQFIIEQLEHYISG